MDKEFDKITFWESDDYDSHDFDPYEEVMNQSGLVICSNRDKVDMGDPGLIDLIEQYHDVELALAGLKKATGKAYKKRTIRGYTQGDWNTLFYPEGTSEELLDTIEDMYMGNYNVYFTEDETVEPNYVYVLDHQLNKQTGVKDIIAQETGLPVDRIVVKQISGYSQDLVYEEKENMNKGFIETEAKWPQIKELLGGRGEFVGKVDEYRDVPTYEYSTEGGQKIVYFFVNENPDDRFEFDAKDEEAIVSCIDAYRDDGVEAADKVWQASYNPDHQAESLTEDKKEEKTEMDNKKKTAKERFMEIDDMVDEAVELPQTIYSVSYVVGDGPYQAIMVKADSEEEAIEKFKKQNPTADVIAAGIEYDPEEMRRRGKPLMEELQDDLSVRKWYMTAFPHDELGYEIKDDIDFEGLDEVLEQGRDVYEYLGVADSIVRERIFDKLADLTGVAYDDIYEKWMNNQEDAEREARVEAEAEDEE